MAHITRHIGELAHIHHGNVEALDVFKRVNNGFFHGV
jgi:hypothetical protein